MKTLLTCIILVTACVSFHAQSVAINADGAAPHPSAILDLQSTSQGFLLPRMTTLQRNSIEGPGMGLMVYDLDMGKFYCYSGSAWVEVMSGFVTVVRDWDADTKIQVEEVFDDDVIRFDVAGTERWVMTGKRLESKNTGQSIFIGTGAGAMDDGLNNKNVFIGDGSGSSNTSGFDNTTIGNESFASNTTGYFNTAIGRRALFSNTAGRENTAVGDNALESNTTGVVLTAVGRYALSENTTGNNNTACGYAALKYNTTGFQNSSFGVSALYSNATGNSNTAVGTIAMYENTTGSFNSALGLGALGDNTSGNYNTATGYSALGYNTTASYGTAVGYSALGDNTDGLSNTAVGYSALGSNTGGDYNVAVGRVALQANTVGSYGTAIGYSANTAATNFLNSSGLGHNADPTAGNRVRIGNSSVSQIGGQVDWSTLSDAEFKTEIREDVVGLDFIKRLRPVTYHYDLDAIDDWYALHYNERDSSDYPEKYEIESIEFSGFLAQEVEQAARDAGFDFSGVCAPTHEDDYYSLRYGTFVVPLVKAVQELAVENVQLKQQLQDLIQELQRDKRIK